MILPIKKLFIRGVLARLEKYQIFLKSGDFGGPFTRIVFYYILTNGHGRQSHVEIEFRNNSKAKNIHAHYRKFYPTLRGWPTCAYSYRNFSSHLGGIPRKSSEITPRRAGSLPI